ncbi:MAG: hypothetical protein JKY91_05810 [Emcibacter sp.]|nr:hypothetical protein [Emcibacter sp.]
MANPAVINQGQSLYTEVTGDAHLFGGVQTGVMVGQTTMWCDLTMQNVTKENLALTKDFSDPAINNGTVKITPSDTALKTLESKLVAGSNIVLDTQDIGGGEEVIVIGSTGGDPVVAMLGGKAVGFQDDTGELYATPQFTVDLATTTTGKPFYYKGNEAAPTTDIIGTSVTDFDFNLFSYTWTQGETKTYEAMTMWATIACEINIRIRPMEDLSTTIIRSEIIRVEAGDVGAPQFLPCYKSFELVAGKIYKMDITKNTTINNVPAKGENLGPSYVPYFGLIYYAPASFAPETLAVEASLYPFVQYVSLPLAVMTATSQPMITAQTLVTGKYKIEYGLSLTTSLNTERRFVGIRVEIDGVKKGGGLGGIESTSGNGNFFDDVSGVVYVDVTEASVSLDVKITASSITNTKIQDVYAYVTKLT